MICFKAGLPQAEARLPEMRTLYFRLRLARLGLCCAGLAAAGLGGCSSAGSSGAGGTALPPSPPAGPTSLPTATGPHGCSATPSTCGYPDATNTGPPAGTHLLRVPGQVSHGPGWHYDPLTQEVDVTGDGSVLTGLDIPYVLNITASDVTISADRIVHRGFFGISLRHTAGVTVEYSTIGGLNATTGRLGSAICDLYGDSTGVVVEGNNISKSKTGVQIPAGLVLGNYIHGFGFMSGDHTNGIFDAGSAQPLTVYRNTILNSYGQTDAVSLDATDSGRPVANKTIEGNLLGGGSFTIYGGTARDNSTANIVIENNRFSQAVYPKGGQYGPIAYYSAQSAGNVWAGNVWDATGQPVLPP
jgi:hypothetical protein